MKKKTVLVVEDNDLNMKLVQSLLTMGKYRGIAADNAETGLEMARVHRPDLILMDIELPGMDGLTAVRRLREDSQLRPIPVVALTAYAMEGDMDRAMAAGFDDYITKPLRIKSFLKTLDGFLRPSEDAGAADPAEHHPARILVVDDEPLNLKLVSSQLAARGYHVFGAEDGQTALELAREKIPDLILLDVMMPGMDGYAVTEALKADSETREIPIIMVTALNGEDDKRRGLAAGADEFLNKPINASELETRVVSLLRLRAYQQQLTTRKASESCILGSGAEGPWGLPLDDLPRVLIVEDDDADARLVEGFLGSIPGRVMWVRDGETALKAMQTQKIDVVLLDILLPGMDGFQVCRKIKNSEETLSIQIVMMTSLSDMESKVRGIRAGTDDFLTKPVNREELRARVMALFRKKVYLDRLRTRAGCALQAAITDELTGIYNRAYFKHFLELELKRSRRYRHPLALLMLDVDHFKAFNDTHGHPAGDRYLHRLGALLQRNLREIDLAARYGGEEFAVVLPYTDLTGGRLVAEKLRAAVSVMPGVNGAKNPIPTISAGLALYPFHADSSESLIRFADEALYRAKEDGRNRISIYGVTEEGGASGRRAGSE